MLRRALSRVSACAAVMLAGVVALVASPAAHAALTINSVDVPTRVGRGQTVSVPVNYTRASGSTPETVTVDVPALLEIVAPLPTGCTLAGASGSPQTLTCPAVDPGGIGSSGSFSFNVRGLTLGGGNVVAANPGPPPSSASDSFSVVSGGDLAVTKSIAPSNVLINGQTATFTLTPTRTGDPVPAGSVITITDQLPGSLAEFTLTGYTAAGYTCNDVTSANNSRSLVCTITGPLTTLPPITLQGRPTLAGAGGLVNNASIAADGTSYIDINSSNNATQLPFTIEPGADPRPTGSFPASAVVNTPQTLTINYVNDGPQSITGGQIRVAIPPGFTIGALPAGCVNSGAGTVNGITGTVITCTAGTVTNGGTQAFNIPLTTPPTAGGGNFGVEAITGPGGSLPGGLTDTNTGNNQTLIPYTIVPPFADLTISKSKTPGPLAAGAPMVNTIVVTNTGIAPAVYSAGTGATPLRVVETMLNQEEYVSASAGWTCTDGGANSGGAGQRRVVCVRDAAGTIAVGGTVPLTLNTRVAAVLSGPVDLTNSACTGGTALTQLGLSSANGPQPPDGNQNGGADCATAASVGTPVVSGQAQVSVLKESSRNGTTWVDPVASAPTVLATDNSMFWRMTVTTPSTGVNPLQQTIPTLSLADTLPAILNVASPGPGIPGYTTPPAVVTTTSSAAGIGSCPSTVAAGTNALNCTFSNVPAGTTITIVVRVDRPFESAPLPSNFTNTATLSSPNAILTASAGGQLADSAALVVNGRTDPAVTSKTVNPPNSATEPRVGQVITYTILARNLGPNEVRGPFTVTDTLDPARFLVLSANAVGSGTSPAMSCNVNTGTGAVSCATPGGSNVQRYDFYTVTVSARILKPTVLPPAGTVSSFTNTATVALDQAQNCEFVTGTSAACNDVASRANNTGSVLVDIKVPLIDVVQKKARVLPVGQSNFGFGDTLRYRLRSQNNGPSRAENIVVTDRLNVPAGYTLTLVGASSINGIPAESGYTLDAAKTAATVNCTQSAANADVVCTLAGGAANFLDPGTEVNFELAFTLVGAPQVTSVGNTSRVCADESTGYETSGSCSFTPALAGNNIASVNDVVFPKTDLSLTKSRVTPGPVAINQPVEYALVLRNNGADPTTQMRLADLLPPNFEWVTGGSFTPTATGGGFAGLSAGTIACTASPTSITAVGQQQTVSCVLDGTYPGSAAATNTVTVRLFARPKQGFFTGPYLSDQANTATVAVGQDNLIPPQPLSIDTNPNNNSGGATVQVNVASLAGTVFEDRDRAGANAGTPQAAGTEPRISGVTVTLTGTDAFGNAISLTTTTDASGNYRFDNLPPSGAAGYTVTQTQPSGFANGPAPPPASGAGSFNAGGTYAQGGASGNSSFNGVALALGTNGQNYNFPEVRVPSLSGFVYVDVNANGVRDAGTDLPISGATVRLLNATTSAVVATATTAADGSYSFPNLDPLIPYTLEQPLPATPTGLVNGPVNPGLIGGAACTSGCTAAPAGNTTGIDRITNIDLGAGLDGTVFNFGEVQNSFIAGTVWIDTNRNNTLDPAEPGRIGGVTITLVQGASCAAGTVLQTTTTAPDGTYRFDPVRAYQNYLVCETQPAGYGNGSAGGVAGSNSIPITNLAPAGSGGNNFGELTASLAGSVFQDTGAGGGTYNDGVRNGTEPGIANVPVTLIGTDILGNPVSLSTTTDASGNYIFEGLLAPNAAGYTVTEGVIPPASGNFVDGRDAAGTAGGTAGNDTTTGITLAAGQQATGYTFGELPSTTITGTVYIDRNNNGTADPQPTDGRLPGVTITLVQGASCATGTVLQTTQTDASGNYSFANVAAGANYLICETQPPGYGNGQQNPTNTITITNLPATGSNGNNFGEVASSLAGSVYVDYTASTPANTNNGVRDAGEVGIAGVTITLTGRDITGATVTRTTITDSNGNWRFDDLLQSDAAGYTVVEGAIPPAAGTFNDGRDTLGTVNGTASGTASPNDTFAGVVLAAGASGINYNFGELPIAPITGTVYIDRDRNNTLGGGDGGIGGVTIRLVQGTDCSGTEVARTTTDSSGNYNFSGVSAGLTYTLCEVQPTGYAEGATNPGAGNTSGAINGITITNLPTTGSAANNFGERVATVAGSVYLDANNDGTRQGSDAGIGGVTVTLTGTDAAGNTVTRTTTTDGSGNYRFDDLLAAGPGGYTVTEQTAQPVVGGVTTLDGRTSAGTIGGAGSGTATAPNTSPSRITSIALPAGGDSIDNNFGEILPVSLAGTVFLDFDNNGVQNAAGGEAGIGGVPLVLTGTDDLGNPVTVNLTTGPDGSYSATGLRPGTYTLTEPTQPAGTSNGQTVPGTAGGTATPIGTTPSVIGSINLTTPGTNSTGNNFGEIPNNSSIAGTVWLDTNNSGTIDNNETGIAGITVELTGTDLAGRTVTRTLTTDAGGRYNFESLAPGTYTVREPTQPPNTVNGTTVVGSTGGTATPVATTPSAISTIPLGLGQSSTANNFGEVPVGSIDGRVYADNNNNGLIDNNEGGLPGVTITLTGTDDLGRPVSLTTTTGPDGSYSFAGLRPGTYTLTEPTQPPGTVGGITTPGTGGGTATAPSVPVSAITGIVLGPGDRSNANNFGEISNSPDLRVSKALVDAVFTAGFPGRYRITVRNVGDLATSGNYTVADRLPTGLTLVATPTGTGWSCVGAAGASTFTCTSSFVVGVGITSPNTIEFSVNVAAVAVANSPVNNAVLVEGGGEVPARGPSQAERDAFNGNPAALPVCTAAVEHNACRTPTPVQLAASISGTVWYDIGGTPRQIDTGDRRLGGWGVEIIDTRTGAVVGRATTGTDGSYLVKDLLPGVPLAVRFRDPGSGVVFGYPVNGDTGPGSSGATCNPQAGATGAASSCVEGGANPALSVVLAPGQELKQQSLPVDPSGVVYDSGLRQPVPGSIVTLAQVGACPGWTPATGLVGAGLGGYTINGSAVSMTVGADGFYQYLFAPSAPSSCTWGLTVTPPAGYTFQSTAIPPTAGPLVPPTGPGSVFAVQPQGTAPTAPIGTGTTYYLTFTTGSGGANIVHNHIPLDPFPPTAISLVKTGDKSAAEVGDSVRYSITVSVSQGPLPRQTTVVDRLPAGFTYIRGTAMVGDVPIADPVSNPPGGLGPVLAFNLGPMPPSRQLVLRYRVRVGVGAQQGDGINRARAHACGAPAGCVDASLNPLAGSIPTNESAFRVRVSGGVFTTDACVLGKIFVDCNNNHIQDKEEIGIPGVRLVMQDGTTLVSDSEGKYSICGLVPRSSVLKVDPITLPRGSRLTTSSNRNLGDAGSLWLDLKNGELHRADFIEGSCSNTVLEQVKARRAQGEVRAPETEKKGGPALRFDSKAHGLSTTTSPQQGTDGANQRLPKPRAPVRGPDGASQDETNVPANDLPMNRPPPKGRDSGQPNDAGASDARR